MFIWQVHHFIKPEEVENYKAATLENVRQSVLEPGILRFEMLQDKEDPTHFSLFEIYRDLEARQSHLETAHFKAWREVALQAFARKGYGHEFNLLAPAGSNESDRQF